MSRPEYVDNKLGHRAPAPTSPIACLMPIEQHSFRAARIAADHERDDVKNPFIAMAMMVAAMQAAFREDRLRDFGGGVGYSRGRSRIPGKRRPAGSKLARLASKNRVGIKTASPMTDWNKRGNWVWN